MESEPDGAPPPTRGPETSSFLMSIVRTLSSSADFEQREKEKARIDKAFRQTQTRLGELTVEHHQDLFKILDVFGSVSKKMNASREKIRKIKEDLTSCKTLLHCKRDELRRLWIDGVEQKAMVAMLDQIEQVKEIPEKLTQHMSKKHYLHATDLIVNSVAILEGPLSGVDALRDLKSELTSKKEQMHEILISELNQQIYVKSVMSTHGIKRGGSGRGTRVEGLGRQIGDGASSQQNAARKTSLKEQSIVQIQQELMDMNPKNIKEDLNSNPEDNPYNYIAVLVESLFVLRRLPDAIEAIKLKIQTELLAIVARESEQIGESVAQQGENLSILDQPQYLLDLLEVVFDQFRCVAKTHQIVLANFHRIIESGVPVKHEFMYDMTEVWSKIQAVVQLLLSEYLDVRNTASSRQGIPSSFDEPTTDVNVYFSKKKPAKAKTKISLFRFDASVHAMSTNSYIEDSRPFHMGEFIQGENILAEMSRHQFVCKPTTKNITAIFKPLQKFIKEIETEIDCPSGSSSLQEFLTDFVQNVFLGQVHNQVSSSISVASKGFDALRNIIDDKKLKELGVPRHLLQSTVMVDNSIKELQELMQDLPDYAEQFLNMICNVSKDYRDTCHSAYRSIVQYDTDEKRVISAMWAKDDDISRFLRSLPSWRTLQPTEGQELNRTVCSEDEMRALNSKEANILISNLASSDSIPQQEIITDVTQMRCIANVHESLEWFAGRLKQLSISLMPRSTSSLSPSPLEKYFDIPPVSQNTLQSLNSLVKDFQELAEICLLLLHLEVRVHCFYYLLPVAKQSNYAGAIDDLDPDSNVLKLNKDLTSMEEVTSQSLQPKKFKYIFETLGYLVASILMNSIQYLKKINENGIKKMCRNIFAVQQNLTNITMTRETDLELARQYYQLLYQNLDDIVVSVAEKGPQFTYQEYTQLFQLYHRSHVSTVTESQLEEKLQKLWEIFEKGQNGSV